MSSLGGHRLVPIRPSPQRGSEGKPPPFVSSASQSPNGFTPPNMSFKRKFSDDESDDSDAESCKRKINFAVNYVVSPQPVSISRRNARERNRVKQVNNGFAALRQHIPSAAKAKKISKVDTLKQAVEYIQNLQQLLAENDEALIREQQQYMNGYASDMSDFSQDRIGNESLQHQTMQNIFAGGSNYIFQPYSPDDENISPTSSFSDQNYSPEPHNFSCSPLITGTKFNFSNQLPVQEEISSTDKFTPTKQPMKFMTSSSVESSPSMLNNFQKISNQQKGIYRQAIASSPKQFHRPPGAPGNELYTVSSGTSSKELCINNQYDGSPSKEICDSRPDLLSKEIYSNREGNLREDCPLLTQENSPKAMYPREQVNSYNRNGPQSVLPVASDPFRVNPTGLKGSNIVHHYSLSDKSIINNMNIKYLVNSNPLARSVRVPLIMDDNKNFSNSVNTRVIKPMQTIYENKQLENGMNATVTKEMVVDENKPLTTAVNVINMEPVPVCKPFLNAVIPSIHKPKSTNENNQFIEIPTRMKIPVTPPEGDCPVLSGDLPPEHLTDIDCAMASGFPSFENIDEVYNVINPTSPLVEEDLLDAIDLWEKC